MAPIACTNNRSPLTTFAELHRLRSDQKAGVSALMLVESTRLAAAQVLGTMACVCDYINGSSRLRTVRSRSGVNAQRSRRCSCVVDESAYWSVQGPVWAQAVANRASDVSSWFSWSDDDSCKDMPGCMGRSVAVPGIGCAQGSWGSEEGYSGEYSALASFGSRSYANYMVDAMANSWTRNLGIDGYCEDVSANYGCMLQTLGRGSMPYWREIVARVRAQQPQVVMSGENYGSWANIIESAADLGGQGSAAFHEIMRHAVLAGDLSGFEETASTSGADAATVVCYLHPAFDGKQPGGCPRCTIATNWRRWETCGRTNFGSPWRRAVASSLSTTTTRIPPAWGGRGARIGRRAIQGHGGT